MGWKNAPIVPAWQTAPPVSRLPFPVTAEIGPIPGRPPIPGAGQAQAAAQAQAVENEPPFFQQFEQQSKENAPLLLGGTAALLAPGPGWGALAASSALGGGFTAGGELARQRMSREELDPARAAEMGTKAAVGSAVVGGSLKMLGALAAKMFHSPMPPQVARAAQFAQREGAPFPLRSAMPTSGAGRVQAGASVSLPGAIRNYNDAQRVTQYLNQRVATMTEGAQVFDDAAREGQAWFANLVNPNKAGATKAWNMVETAAGDTPIPVNSTLAAVREARDALVRAGDVVGKDQYVTRLDAFLNANSSTRLASELNLFAARSAKAGFKGPTGKWADAVQDAIEADVAAWAKTHALDEVADEFAQGLAQRAAYRQLRRVPELERLANELGERGGTRGTIDWMNTLFTKGNGKALAKVREMNPELYHDLADAWLARQIDQFSKFDTTTMMRSLDGQAMRQWFVTNRARITEIFGKPQAQVLDEFTEYASLMPAAVASANRGLGDPGLLMTRGAGEVFAATKKPLIVIPGQAGAFLLARGLSDPSSELFKLFTQGVDPAWRSFAVKAGAITGQRAGSDSKK